MNELLWVTLQVEDVEQSRRFWRDVLGLRVLDLDEVGRLVEREGARALGDAHAIPGGRARDFVDPDGYVFELVELSATI